GGELAADEREQPVDAVPFEMIECLMPARQLVLADTPLEDRVAHAGPRAHGPPLRGLRNRACRCLDYVRHFVGPDRQVDIRGIAEPVVIGGADDRLRAVRYEEHGAAIAALE